MGAGSNRCGMTNLIVGVLLMVTGQILIWFQTNGQFVWDSFKRNPFLLSVIGGTIISYLFITSTKYLVTYFDGLLWPGRLMGFGIGIFAFTFLTWYYMGESVTPKTIVSLILALTLVSIQIFWK